MPESDASQTPTPRRTARWWPGILIFFGAAVAIAWIRAQTEWPFQQQNLTTAKVAVVAVALLGLWWLIFSRTSARLRRGVIFGVAASIAVSTGLFRIRGVSGDLVPILEFRWARGVSFESPTPLPAANVSTVGDPNGVANSFPQYLGPERNGILPGPRFDTNWAVNPPTIIWRQKVGAAWSGFAIVGNVCVTQQQRGENECVVVYELATGKQLWLHADKARYNTAIAGEGPRATPTILSNRVFTCGSTGILNCLDLATGRLVWTRNVVAESGGHIPQWGLTSSPLVANGLVIVHGGENAKRSSFAFDAEDGTHTWSAGEYDPSYASHSIATLADVPQVLAFNHRRISAHNPATGALLWEHPWGNGNVVCSSPVLVGSNRVLFSSGYGYGAELLEISQNAEGTFSAERLWKSPRMKAKFAHLFVRDGFLYGLDDGVFACVDLKDGSQRWKEGRYGHGQGLLVDDLYLLMAESGELVLLRPTPDAANELARFRVFGAKTWNPIAVAGELVLVRNDQEAACLRLRLAP